MNKKYQDYLNSSDWLIKKSNYISDFEKAGYTINCIICQSKNNLVIHHMTYENIFHENYFEGELQIMCKDCHYKWHFKQDFKENWLNECLSSFVEFNKIIK